MFPHKHQLFVCVCALSASHQVCVHMDVMYGGKLIYAGLGGKLIYVGLCEEQC